MKINATLSFVAAVIGAVMTLTGVVQAAEWKRTVIFVQGQTVSGQDMFLRGGIDSGWSNANRGTQCTPTQGGSVNLGCSLEIQHLNQLHAKTNPWRTGDVHLDWGKLTVAMDGREVGQAVGAAGTPAVWTTNDPNYANKVNVTGSGYTPLNKWGQHYWMVDVMMDCAQTVNGWFELKSFISNGPGWEGNVIQSQFGGMTSPPYKSGNHFAKCGMISTFQRGNASAQFSLLPANPGTTDKALILVDQRLYTLIQSNLDEYRRLAQIERGFNIGLRVIQGIDDWHYSQTRTYLINERSANPAMEGVLFVGNIKLPSFYKSRADIINTRLIPRYFEDLDATFAKQYADNATDPLCNGTNENNCAVNGPVTVPKHDFDYTTLGTINTIPEIWTSYLPVGNTAGNNNYSLYANQLNPYLQKVIRVYQRLSLRPNGKWYYVGNDKGEDFPSGWDAFGKNNIDLYGKVGPNGQTGAACLTATGNVCYQRWDMSPYATGADFVNAWNALPWVGEGWQQDSIFINHMNAAFYDVAEVTAHSMETFSLVSSNQARAITKAGLIVTLNGCGVLGMKQPGGANVDTAVHASDNIAMAYLYGSSDAIAAQGSPFWRGHYGHFPTEYKAMKLSGKYLGAAHLERMKKLYDLSGASALALKENTNEMLVGDPFIDLQF